MNRRYGVVVTPEAETAIVAAFRYILLARENEYFEDTLYHLVFKSHRIIFRVDEAKRTVQILYVRHAKQQALGEAAEDERK